MHDGLARGQNISSAVVDFKLKFVKFSASRITFEVWKNWWIIIETECE